MDWIHLFITIIFCVRYLKRKRTDSFVKGSQRRNHRIGAVRMLRMSITNISRLVMFRKGIAYKFAILSPGVWPSYWMKVKTRNVLLCFTQLKMLFYSINDLTAHFFFDSERWKSNLLKSFVTLPKNMLINMIKDLWLMLVNCCSGTVSFIAAS